MKPKAISLSTGIIWFALGALLLIRGFALSSFYLSIILFGLGIGLFKYIFLLSKIAKRNKTHFFQFAAHVPVKQFYPPSYIAIIASFFLTIALFKWLHFPACMMGMLYIAIGFGLMLGSLHYFMPRRQHGGGL